MSKPPPPAFQEDVGECRSLIWPVKETGFQSCRSVHLPWLIFYCFDKFSMLGNESMCVLFAPVSFVYKKLEQMAKWLLTFQLLMFIMCVSESLSWWVGEKQQRTGITETFSSTVCNLIPVDNMKSANTTWKRNGRLRGVSSDDCDVGDLEGICHWCTALLFKMGTVEVVAGVQRPKRIWSGTWIHRQEGEHSPVKLLCFSLSCNSSFYFS